MRRKLIVSLALAVVAVLLAVWLQHARLEVRTPVSSAARPSTTCTPRITRRPIPSRVLGSDPGAILRHVTAAAASNRLRPLHFRGDLPTLLGWQTRAWSRAYFERAAREDRGPRHLAIKRSTTPVVMFATMDETTRPYRTTARRTRKDDTDASVLWPRLPIFELPFATVNVTTAQFFAEVEVVHAAANDSSYPYFADGISVLQDLTRDIWNVAPLCPFEDLTRCDMSVWIGRPNVTAYPHYDASSNLFVQAKGRKRFTLAPPSFAAGCGVGIGPGLYPSLHPAHRQLVHDWLDPNFDISTQMSASDGATRCELEVYESTLEAGDVLYIPTGWFHRVETLAAADGTHNAPIEPSFSINSWWNDAALTELDELRYRPLPFQYDDDAWTPEVRFLATRLYLRAIHAWSPEELVRTRFHALFAGHGEELLTPQRCEQIQGNAVRSSALSLAPYERTVLTCRSTLEDQTLLRAILPREKRRPHEESTDYAKLVAEHFAAYANPISEMIERSPLDPAVVRMYIDSYAEEVAWYTLTADQDDREKVDLLYPFLACCLT